MCVRETILVLDDMQVRIDRFKHQLDREHDVVYAMNADEAIEALKEKTFTLALLDHDLGQGCVTGMEVAKFICTLEKKPRVIIHSHNPVGSHEMFLLLREHGVDVGCRPFAA